MGFGVLQRGITFFLRWAGRSGEEKNYSLKVTSGAGAELEETDIIVLLLQPLTAARSCSNYRGCRHAFQTSASEMSSPAGQVLISLYQHLSQSVFLSLL